MSSHFFAMLARLKWIRRWGLMRNTQEETLEGHTLQTAMIAFHLCLLHNTYFGGHADPKQAAVLAMYHDVPEIFTGDMPTPVKYFNTHMRKTYGEVEAMAKEKLLGSLPEELRPAYAPYVVTGEADALWPFVKAADTLSAYLKCLQEVNAGNGEFQSAFESIGKKLTHMHMPEVDMFLRDYTQGFTMTLDELQQ